MKNNNSNKYLDALLEHNEPLILEIYQNSFDKVKSFIVANNGNEDDTQEIFQKVLCQLVARLKVRKFEITSSFEAYVFTACKNLWRRELNFRKRRVRNDGVIELVTEEQDNSKAILEQERWELLEEKITALSENCKQLLELYFKKVSYTIIVEKFGYANENTAFQRVFKCKRRLMDLVKLDKRFKELC